MTTNEQLELGFNGMPVPVFTRRLGFFRHEIEIAPPIWVSRSGAEEEIEAAAHAAARSMERFLTDNPTQWFHFSH